MKITLITSNQNRHNYLINLLSELSDELFVIQECGTIFPGIVPNHYPKSLVMQRYFKKVNASQVKIFGENFIDSSKKNIKLLSMLFGDLNRCALSFLSDFLKSDIYVIYGSSYIKGDLINFLLKQKV